MFTLCSSISSCASILRLLATHSSGKPEVSASPIAPDEGIWIWALKSLQFLLSLFGVPFLLTALRLWKCFGAICCETWPEITPTLSQVKNSNGALSISFVLWRGEHWLYDYKYDTEHWYLNQAPPAHTHTHSKGGLVDGKRLPWQQQLCIINMCAMQHFRRFHQIWCTCATCVGSTCVRSRSTDPRHLRWNGSIRHRNLLLSVVIPGCRFGPVTSCKTPSHESGGESARVARMLRGSTYDPTTAGWDHAGKEAAHGGLTRSTGR